MTIIERNYNKKMKEKVYITLPYDSKWWDYNPEMNEWFDNNNILRYKNIPVLDEKNDIYCIKWPFDTEEEATLFLLKWA